MAATKKNYKSDFDAILHLKSCVGDVCTEAGWPDYDWTARFYTTSHDTVYIASNIGGVLTNCFNDNGNIHVVFNNHGLPSGTLRVEFIAEIPNDIYPDGSQLEVSPQSLDIELVRGLGDCGTIVDVDVMLSYIKGERGERGPKGDKGDKGDTGDGFTPEQSDKLDTLPTAEELSEELSEAELGVFRKLWTEACKSVCRRGVTYGGVNADGLPVLYDEVLTWDEAIHIYNISHKSPMHLMTQEAYIYGDKLGRFFLPLRVTMHECNMRRTFQGCNTLEAIALDAWSEINLSPGEEAFDGCNKLKRIIGNFQSVYRSANIKNIFKRCNALREVRFWSNTSFSFADSPLLSRESVAETLKRAGTDPITITVHADVYAKLTGDTTNAAAAALSAEELAAWQQIVTDAADKNISFATA